MKDPRIKRVLCWATAIFVFDAYVENFPALSAWLGVWMIFVALPRACYTKDPALQSYRSTRVCIYLGVIPLVIASIALNNHYARQRADRVVAAIETYHQRHQTYPQKLSDLVPEFLPYVPQAKFCFMPVFAPFMYAPPGQGRAEPLLIYFYLPPFGHESYLFSSHAWRYRG